MREDRAARPLGLASLLALGVNGIVGVGIFFAPAEVARSVPGYLGVAVYPLTALALAPVACCYAALGGRFSVDGGPYVWARRAFGARLAFVVGWTAYASALVSMAAVVAGFARHLAPVLGVAGPLAERLIGAAAALALAGTAASGLRLSAIAWSTVTVLKLAPLCVLVSLGIAAGLRGAPAGIPVGTESLALERAILVVVFSLQGFEVVPVVAGSVQRASRAVPAATLGALLIAAVLYSTLHATCVHALPDLGGSRTPLVDAAGAHGGVLAERMVAVGANLSALGIALGMFAVTPRYLAVLGRADGLGRWLGLMDARRVPKNALLVTSVAVVVLLAFRELAELFVLSSVAVLLQYAVSALALAVLAARRRDGFSRGQLWIALLALGAVAVAARGAGWIELSVTAGVVLVGAALAALRFRLRRAAVPPQVEVSPPPRSDGGPTG